MLDLLLYRPKQPLSQKSVICRASPPKALEFNFRKHRDEVDRENDGHPTICLTGNGPVKTLEWQSRPGHYVNVNGMEKFGLDECSKRGQL